jgi:hypothetical protein
MPVAPGGSDTLVLAEVKSPKIEVSASLVKADLKADVLCSRSATLRGLLFGA